ncbi:hypothetical protein CDD83_10206 [Cordyceps sp. RAO-2017]|nr:hypothetical protein CDD83_10206 [Cordyceps sp. RAO-2017]
MGTVVNSGARPTPHKGGEQAGGGDAPKTLGRVERIVIGSTLGCTAAIGFFAVLVLLALRYKKRRDGRALPADGHLGPAASRAITGGDSTAMAEGPGQPTVTGPFSNPTDKTSAPATASSAERGGERGFYRVAGRKLPSVLFTGGDGYSDPRGSIMSERSDYHRGSQAFDVAADGQCQLSLGKPMRPVSGIPIMRSGPARTPVTENPFVDPLAPPGDQEPAGRPPGSRDSQRGPASKFQERI